MHDLSELAGKVRVRVCGLLEEEEKLLLIRHESLGELGYAWLPPGGGIKFGETSTEALKREFMEETNLNIEVTEYLFSYEHIDSIHHALEIFYRVRRKSGALKIGKDPEFDESKQIISKLELKPYSEINMMDNRTLHGIFNHVKSAEKVFDLRGLFRFNH